MSRPSVGMEYDPEMWFEEDAKGNLYAMLGGKEMAARVDGTWTAKHPSVTGITDSPPDGVLISFKAPGVEFEDGIAFEDGGCMGLSEGDYAQRRTRLSLVS